MEASRQVQRFIILSTARTGSNYLMFLLSAHENIRMFGELFNLDTLPEETLREALDNPIQYMNRRLDGPFDETKKAVGFKLFYDHLTPDYFDKKLSVEQLSEKNKNKFIRFNGYVNSHYSMNELQLKFDQAWNNLVNDKTIKIIHLRRKNKLGTFLSLKTALLKDEWMLLKNKESSKTLLQLDYDECYGYFERLEANEKKHAMLFNEHDKIELTYEDLVENKEESLNKLFDFLDLPQRKVSTILKKQIPFAFPEIVVNYAELKNKFESTPWKEFFVEETVEA